MTTRDRHDLNVLIDVCLEAIVRDPNDPEPEDWIACAFSILADDEETNP